MLTYLFGYHSIIYVIGVLFTFFCSFFCIGKFKNKMPLDQGKALAVDSMKSAGKPEGVGLIYVCVFIVGALLFGSFTIEKLIYLVLIGICMLTGFLDDCSKIPWHEYLKGALDLFIAALVAVTYIYFNGTTISLFLFEGYSFDVHPVLLGFFIVCLVWWSINVTNCSDGVDGLSASLSICTLLSFCLINGSNLYNDDFDYYAILYVICLLAYLWYNANPSILLMGDAGSRPMGMLIAMVAIKSGDPLLYFLFAAVLIADGGIGLIKVALKRFLHISILKNTRTPLHDHAKNVWGRDKLPWILVRFTLLQVLINAVILVYLIF